MNIAAPYIASFFFMITFLSILEMDKLDWKTKHKRKLREKIIGDPIVAGLSFLIGVWIVHIFII